LLDNFTWGNPEKPDRLGSLVQACQGCYDIAREFETPFISGKDSLYNESPLGPVTPTLLITAIGVIPDVRHAVSADLKVPGNSIYVVGQTLPELGGSAYYKLLGLLGETVPKVNTKRAKEIVNSMVKAIDLGCVEACHDASEGGLAVALAEMTFASRFGVDLWLKKVPKPRSLTRDDVILFSESNSRFIVEVDKRRTEEFEHLMRDNVCEPVGRVKSERSFTIYGVNERKLVDVDLAKFRKAWKTPLGAYLYEAR
jgi:phosphoribosylformylglycinamidine synthase